MATSAKERVHVFWPDRKQNKVQKRYAKRQTTVRAFTFVKDWESPVVEPTASTSKKKKRTTRNAPSSAPSTSTPSDGSGEVQPSAAILSPASLSRVSPSPLIIPNRSPQARLLASSTKSKDSAARSHVSGAGDFCLPRTPPSSQRSRVSSFVSNSSPSSSQSSVAISSQAKPKQQSSAQGKSRTRGGSSTKVQSNRSQRTISRSGSFVQEDDDEEPTTSRQSSSRERSSSRQNISKSASIVQSNDEPSTNERSSRSQRKISKSSSLVQDSDEPSTSGYSNSRERSSRRGLRNKSGSPSIVQEDDDPNISGQPNSRGQTNRSQQEISKSVVESNEPGTSEQLSTTKRSTRSQRKIPQSASSNVNANDESSTRKSSTKRLPSSRRQQIISRSSSYVQDKDDESTEINTSKKTDKSVFEKLKKSQKDVEVKQSEDQLAVNDDGDERTKHNGPTNDDFDDDIEDVGLDDDVGDDGGIEEDETSVVADRSLRSAAFQSTMRTPADKSMSIIHKTPASGPAIRVAPKRRKPSPAPANGAKQAKKPSKPRQKPVPTASRAKVCLWIGGGHRRKAVDTTDLDVVLSKIEDITFDYKETLQSKPKRKGVRRFFQYVERDFTEQIDLIHETNTLKLSLTKMNSTLRKQRKELLEIQQRNIRLNMELDEMKAESSKKDNTDESLHNISTFLYSLQNLQKQYANTKPDDDNVEFVNSSNLDSLLEEAKVTTTSKQKHTGLENQLQDELVNSSNIDSLLKEAKMATRSRQKQKGLRNQLQS